MVTAEDIESFIGRLAGEGVHSREVEPGLWVLTQHADGPSVVVHHSPPVVVLRVKVMELTAKQERPELYRHLLELNAKDLVHGSYGIDGSNVVLTDALELENLDFNEFQAVIDDMTMAVSKHYPFLSKFVEHHRATGSASAPAV